MVDLGVVNHIIGCEAQHTEDTGVTYLSQYQYSKKAAAEIWPED